VVSSLNYLVNDVFKHILAHELICSQLLPRPIRVVARNPQTGRRKTFRVKTIQIGHVSVVPFEAKARLGDMIQVRIPERWVPR
jgi:hypothetical protein